MLFAVAQRELELAGEQEVSMQWVAIDADPAMDVDGCVHDSVAANRRPIRSDRDLIVGGLPASRRHAACHAVSVIASASM